MKKGTNMSFFKLGKTHVPHRKNTAGQSAVRLPAPAVVSIPMSQHIGAPSVPSVKVGDKVFVGTKIAEAGGFVSSPAHSSVSGTVKKIEPLLMSGGASVQTIVIESDGEMTPDPAIVAPRVENFDDFVAAVRESGLVGLGGAGFPTAVKLEAERKGLINTIILNGAECEPYITSDTLTMTVDAEYVRRGVEWLEKYISAERVIIGIEENKPEAIAAMREAFSSDGRVTVMPLPSTYPQGAEKVLIYNTTGRVVPEGKLPADVGCLVMNVTSVAFLAKYMETGMPLVEKCVTVDGSAVREPKNIIAPIGTPVSSLLDFAGGVTDDCEKVMYGGPMMGITLYSTDYPIMKNNNAIVALSAKDTRTPAQRACIHCGRCVAACPMSLNPTLFAKAMKLDDKADAVARLTAAKINLCVECGSCSFVCPSVRPLVETNRLAKAAVRAANTKK